MLEIIIGFLSGTISGMGIGGGAILIPALVFICGANQRIAQGVNLAFFIPTAIAALIVHIKNKNLEIKTALAVGLSGAFASALGATLAGFFKDTVLRKMFGIFLLFVGIYEIYCGFVKKITK